MSASPLVVFITHNSSAFIAKAINSCLKQDLSIYVVDNASTDDTLAAIPAHSNVRVLASPANLGFAGGVNRAVRESDSPLILLLNPDTELLDPIGPMLAPVVEKRHSAAAGLLVNPSGIPQKGFSFRRLPTVVTLAFEVLGINRIWPGNPVNRRFRCLDVDPLLPQEIEQPAGACFLFCRSDWERLGGFDEAFYPVWFEDVDFCKRLLAAGGSIWFSPSVRILHHGGHSVQKIELGCRQRVWYGSLLTYAVKHFSPSARRVLAVTVGFAVVPRILFRGSGESFRSRSSSIKFIWRLARKCFQTGRSTEDVPGGKP